MHNESMAVLAGALNLVFPLPPTDDKPPEGDKFKKGRMATVKLTTVHSPRIGSIEELLRGEAGRQREEKPSSGGALHKAKKHLKTLMSGGSKRSSEKAAAAQAANDDRDSDSESTLVSSATSRSTSTLNSTSTSELDYLDVRQYGQKDREARREERKRIIAERHAIRSRANSISDESHSPTCPNPVLCRRFSRDIDSLSSTSSSYHHHYHSHHHLHLHHQPHQYQHQLQLQQQQGQQEKIGYGSHGHSQCFHYSHSVTSHLPIFRSVSFIALFFISKKSIIVKLRIFCFIYLFIYFLEGEAKKVAEV